MVKDKIKALFILTGTKQKELAEQLGISKQYMWNKLNKPSYKDKDLIEIAKYTGTTLAFIDKNGKPVVTFDMEDIKE